MTEFLTHIIICSLFCVGFHAVTGEGMLLEFLTKPFKTLPYWIKKPFFSCPPCMGSVWGIAYYIPYIAAPAGHFIDQQVFLFIFCVAGLNAVLVKFFG